MSELIPRPEATADPSEPETKAFDAKTTMSPVLARLIEEVRNESIETVRAYNRVHHRHNR